VQGPDLMTADERSRPHRPAVRADLTDLIDAAGGTAPASRAEIASATAAAVVGVGRSAGHDTEVSDETLVGLADRVGLDTLAELWRDADPVSLPGALWALYLLRQWCHSNGDEVTRLWRAGEALAPADAVVAGVGEFADLDAVRRVADAVLTGAYRGDFAVALERAAAVFRVVAAGRRDVDSDDDASRATAIGLAQRNEAVAERLTRAAALWRAGRLH
jgi:hypothetical protein